MKTQSMWKDANTCKVSWLNDLEASVKDSQCECV